MTPISDHWSWWYKRFRQVKRTLLRHPQDE
jgi:hypothetical protein